MSELKTKKNDASVTDFINSIENNTRREDGQVLLEMFSRVTGETPRMWGTSIVGFGKYHYKSERSKQEGDWPLVGFSPRKQNLTLYVIGQYNLSDLLQKLGKHKTSAGCLYINKLSDVDMTILEQIVGRAYQESRRQLL